MQEIRYQRSQKQRLSIECEWIKKKLEIEKSNMIFLQPICSRHFSQSVFFLLVHQKGLDLYRFHRAIGPISERSRSFVSKTIKLFIETQNKLITSLKLLK